MEASLFAKILSDKSLLNLKKLRYKYPQADMGELVDLLKASATGAFPLPDFAGNNLVYLENVAQVRMRSVKLLLAPQSPDVSRDSVRKILRGYAPGDESEHRIYGLEKGLEFIADPTNEITEESVHELPYNKLPSYMDKLVAFIQTEDAMNDLLKAAIIHFYIAYLHPYFDGNGRMARLLHLWYLRSQGYSSAPLSSYIECRRQSYFSAYSLAEKNFSISGVMDVSPFLTYFIEQVYCQSGGAALNAAPPL